MGKKEDKELKIKKADLILILSVLGLSLLILVLYNVVYQENGKWVVVYQEGVEIERHALDEDGTYVIGESNTFQVFAGSVNMTGADCNNQICVNHVSIEHVGETIVCLPNKIVLVIEGEGDNISLDAVVY